MGHHALVSINHPRRIPEKTPAARALPRKPRTRAIAGERRSALPVGNPESTRERILTSAARLFAELGFENTSMPEIAKASGITAGAIYKHFESKGELLLEVVKRAIQSIPLFLQGAEGTRDASALPRLAALYTEPELKLVRQLSIEVHSAAAKDPKVDRLLAQSDELSIQRIGEGIAEGQRAGLFDSSLDADFTARLFSVFIMGLIHMETLLPGQVGDSRWRDFVEGRVAALLGIR
jgi:TetR/AcrR family transcriptional regulator, transcriptional repressor of aconitase